MLIDKIKNSLKDENIKDQDYIEYKGTSWVYFCIKLRMLINTLLG